MGIVTRSTKLIMTRITQMNHTTMTVAVIMMVMIAAEMIPVARVIPEVEVIPGVTKCLCSNPLSNASNARCLAGDDRGKCVSGYK
jgi:hypothetical protein